MNIYENNKKLLTTMGGDSKNLATDYEVRKAILDLLGGDSSNCNSIYEVDKQILNIYLEGGGGTGGNITLQPITITENGVYTAGVGNGYNKVTVNVEIPECPEIPLTAITINSNGTYIPEEGGYNEVIVDVAGGSGGTGGKAKVKQIKVDNNCIENGTWDASVIDTSNVTNMDSMFNGCTSLQSLDLSGWNTSNVTDMYYMFSGCTSLQTLDVSGFDTSNVTKMGYMFNNCKTLQTLDVSGFDTSNVTNAQGMYNMFSSCNVLKSVGDLSGWDTSNVMNMGGMFSNCTSLQTLDVSGFDTSNVTNMANMFIGCKTLQTLDVSGFDTSNVTNMGYMFYNLTVQQLDLTNFNASKVTSISTMSKNSTTQSYVGGRTIDEVITNDIKILNGLKISTSDILSNNADRASLRALINGLADLTGSTSQSVTLSADLKAKLIEEDIAVATAKNWTIS